MRPRRTSNIQHPTSNSQWPRGGGSLDVGCWTLDAGCFSALLLRSGTFLLILLQVAGPEVLGAATPISVGVRPSPGAAMSANPGSALLKARVAAPGDGRTPQTTA